MLICENGFRRVFKTKIAVSQHILYLRVIEPCGQRLLLIERRRGIFPIRFVGISHGEIIPEGVLIRIQLDRSPDGSDRSWILFEVYVGDAECLPAIGLIRIQFERAAIAVAA